MRILWAFHLAIGTEPQLTQRLLLEKEDVVRAWAIRLAFEEQPASELLARLPALAATEPSPVVRLALASSLQRLPVESRIGIAEALAARAEDAQDANMPLMLWYAIEPIVAADENSAIRLIAQAKIPKLRRFITQRLVQRGGINRVSELLAASSDPALMSEVVRGLDSALNGQRNLPVPANWDTASRQLASHPDSDTRDTALQISLIFGQESAVSQLLARATDKTASAANREKAIQTLIQGRVKTVVPVLQQLLDDEAVRAAAIRGLASFEDPATPKRILQVYPKLAPAEKVEAINTLAGRAGSAVALLEAVKAGAIPQQDISPFVARQLQTYKEPRVQTLVKELGSVRSVSGEKAERIAHFKKILTPENLDRADLANGRVLFNRTCAPCHTLFDSGGALAPELTGSQRANLDYLLENVVDPNAIVWDRYKATYFETSDDRLISGVVVGENDRTITIHTQSGAETLPRSDIVSRRQSNLSMMPEGLFDALDEKDLIDLTAYLQSPRQVSLPDQATGR